MLPRSFSGIDFIIWHLSIFGHTTCPKILGDVHLWGQKHQMTTSKTTTRCANQNKLANLAFGVCKISYISNYKRAKDCLKMIECPKVRLNGQCEHKGRSYVNIKNIFH
jgi:hypothetical protein